MKIHLSALCATFLMAATAAMGDTLERWSGTSDITFSGTSTLHNWQGTVKAKPFTSSVARDASGQPSRVQATVVVEATQMDTAEPKRDENMKKAMKVGDFPLITGLIDAPFALVSASGSTPAKLPIKLKLLDTEQDVTGVVSNWKLEGKNASFDLDFDVSMKASGIKVPAVLLFIRVGDTVKVHATVTLTQS